MQRLFILATILFLAAPAYAQAPTGTLGNAAPRDPSTQVTTPGPTTSGVNSSTKTRQTNPVLDLFGMPCSVSLNATGGVTTSASCGTDPLEVPTQTVGSSSGAGGGASASGGSTGGTQARQGAGGTAGSNAAQGAGSTSAASTSSSSSAGGGSAPGPATLCSSGLPTTGGSSSAGSIVGGC